MAAHQLEYVESGNTQSDTVLFLVHGWPDGPDLWRKVLPKLQEDYLCVNLALPTYERVSSERKRWFHRQGCFFGPNIIETSDLLFETIDAVAVGYPMKKRAILSHDWGSVLAEVVDMKNPRYFNGGIIKIDVTSTGYYRMLSLMD